MSNSLFCAIGFNNKKKIILLQLHLLFSKKRVYFYDSCFFKRGLIWEWLVEKGKISFRDNGVAQVKGLYYRISKRTLELTELFFERFIRDSYLFRYAAKLRKTNKYECYLKKCLSYDILDTLSGLCLVKEFSKDKKIIVIDNPVNRQTVNGFLENNRVNVEVHWLNFGIFFWLEFILYYLTILKTILSNGIIFKSRRHIKLYKEATWGCVRPTLRDDVLIDDNNFKREDIVFYSRHNEDARNTALAQLKSAGYAAVDLRKCKLNVKDYLFLFIRTFLIQPFGFFWAAYINKMRYQSDYILKYYLESLPHFLFLTNYDARCHISTSDHGEVAETIIMNMFGCKNVLYIWSDKTPYKDVFNAFTAHNLYYSWGPIHYEFQREFYYYDKVETVGCIFLKVFFDTIEKNENKRESKRKTILICDNSFGNNIGVFSENLYLDYLDLAIELLNKISDTDLIFKSKNWQSNILDSFLSNGNKKKYLEKISFLNSSGRFAYYDISFQIEPFIALSDMVITMGMTSPSMIALILGKEAVYYDMTGNDQHPMTRYKNKVVFDDKEMLIGHIKGVLDKKESVFKYIDDKLLNSYDPYRDSGALNRLIKAIYRETLVPVVN